MILNRGFVLFFVLTLCFGLEQPENTKNVGVAPVPFSNDLAGSMSNELVPRRRSACTPKNVCIERADTCTGSTEETCEQTSQQCTGGWKDMCTDTSQECAGSWTSKCTKSERKCSGGWKNVCSKTTKQCTKFLGGAMSWLCSAWDVVCTETSKVCKGWEVVCTASSLVCDAWQEVCIAPIRVCNTWETVCTGTTKVSCDTFETTCIAYGDVCTVVEDVVEVVETAVDNLGQCLDTAFSASGKNIIDTACYAPAAQIGCYARAIGSDITDGFEVGCPFPDLAIGVAFGSAEEDGDKDTAIFYVDVGSIEIDVPLFQKQWKNSVLKDFVAFSSELGFTWENDAQLAYHGNDDFVLTLPGLKMDFDSQLTLMAETTQDPCAANEDDCKIILNKGRTTLMDKAFAAGPVPVVVEITAEVYLMAAPKMEGNTRVDIKLYFSGDGVDILNTAGMPLDDATTVLDELAGMFDPSAIADEFKSKLKFEVSGELDASAELKLCVGVEFAFKVNGIGLNMDIPICLTAELNVAANADLTAASLTVGTEIYLDAIEVAAELDMPLASAVVDTACGYVQMIDTGVLGDCIPAISCFEHFTDDLCDGISDAVDVLDIDVNFGTLTIMPQIDLYENSWELNVYGAVASAPVASPTVSPTGEYALGDIDTNDCPSGYVHIENVWICEKAASSLLPGLWQDGHDGYDWGDQHPKGCFLQAGTIVYFNDDNDGAATVGDTPLCQLYEDPDGYTVDSGICYGEYDGDMGVYGYQNTPDVATCADQCNADEKCVSFVWDASSSDPCRLSWTCTLENKGGIRGNWRGYYKDDAATWDSCGWEDMQEVYIGCGSVFVSEQDRAEQCDEDSATKMRQAFSATGCPNDDVSDAQIAYWESKSDSYAWSDMKTFCDLTQAGTASNAQREACCGAGNYCTPSLCHLLTDWPGNYLETTVMTIENGDSCGIKRGQTVWATNCGVYTTETAFNNANGWCLDDNTNQISWSQEMPIIFDRWAAPEYAYVPHEDVYATPIDNTIRTLAETKLLCDLDDACDAFTCEDSDTVDECMMASSLHLDTNNNFNTYIRQFIPGALFTQSASVTSFPMELETADSLGLDDTEFSASAWVRRTESDYERICADTDSGTTDYYCQNDVTGEMGWNDCAQTGWFDGQNDDPCRHCMGDKTVTWTLYKGSGFSSTRQLWKEGDAVMRYEEAGTDTCEDAAILAQYTTDYKTCKDFCDAEEECYWFFFHALYTDSGDCTLFSVCMTKQTVSNTGGQYMQLWKACTNGGTAKKYSILGTQETAKFEGLHLVVKNEQYHIGFKSSGCRVPAVNHVNTWEHVAVSYKANTMEVYVDGVLTQTCTGMSDFIGTGMVSIGQSLGGDEWVGSIKDVRVFENALDSNEASALYYASHYGQDIIDHDITAWCVDYAKVAVNTGPNGDTNNYSFEMAKWQCMTNDACMYIVCNSSCDEASEESCCYLAAYGLVFDVNDGSTNLYSAC